MDSLFDHEKLDVYCLELGFVAWLAAFLDDASHWSAQHRRELIEQLDRASLSVLLNTAEGNGQRQGGPSFSRTPVARPSSAPPGLMRRSPKASSRSRSPRERNACPCRSNAHPLDRSLRHRRSPPSQVTIPLTRARPRVASLNHPQSCSCLCSVFVRCR